MLDDVILYYTTVLGLSILPFLMSFLMLLMMMMMMPMLNWCMLVVVFGSILRPPSALLDRQSTAKNWRQSLLRSTLLVKVWSPKKIWWKLWTSLWWLGCTFWRGHQADVFCVSRLCDDVRLTPRIPKTFGCMRFSILRHFKTIHYTSLYV